MWKKETTKDGKPTKIPYQINGINKASTTNPKTWNTFEDCTEAFESGEFSGIGFVFSHYDNFIGLDWDHVRNKETGEFEPGFLEEIKSLNSYAELSQSGEGAHVIAIGKMPGDKKKREPREMYENSRFFVVTGNHIEDTPKTIHRAPEDALQAIYNKIDVNSGEDKPKKKITSKIEYLQDDAIIEKCERAKNADKFKDLFNGSISGYDSHSNADQALCNILAFYTRDESQIDRIFRKSGLHRKKWDEKRGNKTYGQITVESALREVPESYSPNEKQEIDIASINEIINSLTVPETQIEKAQAVKQFLIVNCKNMELSDIESLVYGDIKTKFAYKNKTELKSIVADAWREIKKQNKAIAYEEATKESVWTGCTTPKGYGIEDGYVVKIEYNKDIQEYVKTNICGQCIISNTGEDIDTGDKWVKVTFLDENGEEREEWITKKDAYTKNGVMGLTLRGLDVIEKNAHSVTDYYLKCVRENAKNYDKAIVAKKNGWKRDNKIFVFGNQAYAKNCVKDVLMIQKKATDGIIKKGTLEGWTSGVKDIIDYPIVRFKMYASASAILLNLLNVQSVVVDNPGESSTGKSFSSRAGASMFGSPLDLEVNGNTTQTGIEILAEMYSDLPLYLDETGTQADERLLKNLVYMLGNGQGRLRGNKDVTLRDVGTWRTVAFTTGEQPITADESFSGQQVRVIEIKGGLPDGIGREVKHAYESIYENHGHIAELYLERVFKYKDMLRDMFLEKRKIFSTTGKNTGDRQAEHFAVFTLAGEMLEEVFDDVGLDAINPEEITQKYFDECVKANPIESYSIRALKDTIDWMQANISTFYISGKDYLNAANKHTVNGWMEETTIDVIPKQLKTAIKNCGYNPRRVINEWAEAGIIEVKINKKGERATEIITSKTEQGEKKSKRIIRMHTGVIQARTGLDFDFDSIDGYTEQKEQDIIDKQTDYNLDTRRTQAAKEICTFLETKCIDEDDPNIVADSFCKMFPGYDKKMIVDMVNKRFDFRRSIQESEIIVVRTSEDMDKAIKELSGDGE